MGYPLSILKKWTNAHQLGHIDLLVDEMYYDTRIIHRSEQGLFVALVSNRTDGHDFIEQARLKGIKAFLVDRPIVLEEDEVALVVPNTLEALQKISENHRLHFDYPVVGVTGSYGKTVVKEWFSSLIRPFIPHVTNPRSFNSQIGVPLSVWKMNQHVRLAIFESGISQTGEMRTLQKIIRPTHGIFINIGEAHAKGFPSKKEKAWEKAQLFIHSRFLVYSVDYPEIVESVSLIKKENTSLITETFSIKGNDADLSLMKNENGWTATYHQFPIDFQLPFSDQASVENAAAAFLSALQMGFLPEQILPRLSHLEQVEMRLQQKQAINQCQLINDSYGNTIDGLSVALDFWLTQKSRSKRTLIVSDLAESDKEDIAKYRWLARRLRHAGVNRLIGIGPQMISHQSFFHGHESLFFQSTEDFLAQFSSLQFFDESILLKGARIFGFERIEKLLGAQKHRTVLEVNLDAIEHNYRIYRSIVPKKLGFMVMVKAFAYGSGLLEVASRLQYLGAQYLAVAYTDEGVALRKAGITLPIMVMNPEEESFDLLVEFQLEPEIFGFRIMDCLSRWMQDRWPNKSITIHIKVDTGMHRLGFLPNEIESLSHQCTKHSCLRIGSLMTHLAASEDENQDIFTQNQIHVFHQFADQFEQFTGFIPMRHCLNTAGIARHSTQKSSLVRLGIGLYGVDPSQKIQDKLQQVSRLKTIISQIKELKSGDTVGYGRVGIVDRPKRVGTIAIGYADGISRIFGNGNASFYVNGHLAPTIGNICMDMCMIDLDGIDAEEGDDVIIFGPEQTLSQICQQVGMIPYEMLTGISPRVKRVYIKE